MKYNYFGMHSKLFQYCISHVTTASVGCVVDRTLRPVQYAEVIRCTVGRGCAAVVMLEISSFRLSDTDRLSAEPSCCSFENVVPTDHLISAMELPAGEAAFHSASRN